MYYILKVGSGYINAKGEMVYDRASALHVDPVTVRVLKSVTEDMGHEVFDDLNLRVVTVTTRADRAARNVTSMSDPQSAQ